MATCTGNYRRCNHGCAMLFAFIGGSWNWSRYSCTLHIRVTFNTHDTKQKTKSKVYYPWFKDSTYDSYQRTLSIQVTEIYIFKLFNFLVVFHRGNDEIEICSADESGKCIIWQMQSNKLLLKTKAEGDGIPCNSVDHCSSMILLGKLDGSLIFLDKVSFSSKRDLMSFPDHWGLYSKDHRSWRSLACSECPSSNLPSLDGVIWRDPEDLGSEKKWEREENSSSPC